MLIEFDNYDPENVTTFGELEIGDVFIFASELRNRNPPLWVKTNKNEDKLDDNTFCNAIMLSSFAEGLPPNWFEVVPVRIATVTLRDKK